MSSKHIAVIFRADATAAQQLSEGLEAEGLEVIAASNSDHFYHVLNHQRVDLVVIDQDLNGLLSGMEILERIFSELLRPATALIGQLDSTQMEKARRLGIGTILSPATEVGEILTSIRALQAKHAVSSQLIISSAARLLVRDQADKIKPLPQLLIKLCTYLSREDLSMQDLAKDIAVDPKITAQLLKLTNSTAVGLRHKVTKVLDAVTILGARRTIALILSDGVVQAQSGMARRLPDWFRIWYQQRSVLIASAASAFARHLDDVSADTAFILGLLQDVGILVLGHAYQDRYFALLQRVKEVGQIHLEFTERQDFRVSHDEVSAALLQKWELPQSMMELVLAHHSRDDNAHRSETTARFLHTMRVGEAIANLADNCSPHRYKTLAQLLAPYGVASASTCRLCLAEAVAKAAESSQLFAIPVPDEAALNKALSSLQFSTEGDEFLRLDEPGENVIEPVALPDGTGGKGKQTILLIADQQPIIDLLTKTLNPLGFVVVSCQSEAEVLQLASAAPVIFCDSHLEHQTGLEIVRAVRAQGVTQPIVMMSSDRSREMVLDCIDGGISAFLVKPFDRETLLAKVGKFVELDADVLSTAPAAV